MALLAWRTCQRSSRIQQIDLHDTQLLKAILDGALLKAILDGVLLKAILDSVLLKAIVGGVLLKAIVGGVVNMTHNHNARGTHVDVYHL